MAINDLHKIMNYVGQLNSSIQNIEFTWKTNGTEIPDNVKAVYNELKLAIFNFRNAITEDEDDILPQ